MSYQNLYDAIAALRSNWIWGQPVMACGCEPAVYINGSRARTLESLRTVPPAAGMRVMRLTPREAAARYGQGHEGGAIVVEIVLTGPPLGW